MNYTKTFITDENIEMLKTLSHPIRVEIITILMQHNTLNVSELVNKLHIPQSTVSQHLSKMKGKIVACDRRGSEMYYHISNPKVPQIIEILLSTNK
ncbi:metalloregulator ArsR/SmtB family transcription factor [Bacillus cereus]|nr:metalloregulator ArsR/SmtB family transcription factor [Bacillus cereus]MDA2497058.1 metalloregulator ArsR/SmtB family transcription factor [Bacillus cereus]